MAVSCTDKIIIGAYVFRGMIRGGCAVYHAISAIDKGASSGLPNKKNSW